MTKEQKKISKKIKKRHQFDEFIFMLISQQEKLGVLVIGKQLFCVKKGGLVSPIDYTIYAYYSICDLSIHANFSWT